MSLIETLVQRVNEDIGAYLSITPQLKEKLSKSKPNRTKKEDEFGKLIQFGFTLDRHLLEGSPSLLTLEFAAKLVSYDMQLMKEINGIIGYPLFLIEMDCINETMLSDGTKRGVVTMPLTQIRVGYFLQEKEGKIYVDFGIYMQDSFILDLRKKEMLKLKALANK